MPTPGVDFFRVDRSAPTYRILALCAVAIMVGVLGIGAHLVHRIGADAAHVISVAGGVSVLAGLVVGFGSMAVMLFENAYLAIKDEGVIVHDNGKETTIAWDDLAAIEVEERVFVALRRQGAPPIRFHAGKAAPDITAKVEEAKRKAAHGLLKLDAS